MKMQSRVLIPFLLSSFSVLILSTGANAAQTADTSENSPESQAATLDLNTLAFTSTPAAGGTGGSFFNDGYVGYGSKVIGYVVRSGNYVDGIQFLYETSSGGRWSSPFHGGQGGGQSVIFLGQGEYITGADGRAGAYVDAVRFDTNRRSLPWHGGGGYYRIFCPAGYQVVSLYGRSGGNVDQMGFSCRN